MKWLTTKNFVILFFIAVNLAWIVMAVIDHLDSNEVRGDYSTTQGWITLHADRGGELGGGATVEYRYKANDKIFSRKKITYVRLECSMPACSNRRFWVIYSNSDNSKSLINFKEGVFDTRKAEFPKNLDDFE